MLTTSKGTYLQLDDQVLLLCGKRWGILPIGISVPDDGNLNSAEIQRGQEVLWQDGILKFPDVQFALQLEVGRMPQAVMQPLPERLQQAETILMEAAYGRGLVPIYGAWMSEPAQVQNDLYCRAALPHMNTLIRGLLQEDGAAITNAARGLLGLGKGLTPSADDFLCGMVYVFLRSIAGESATVKNLCQMLQKEAGNGTNAISAAYLAAISAGAEYERMYHVLKWLSGEGEACIRELLEVGSSSGADMLMGMLAACEILQSWETALNSRC